MSNLLENDRLLRALACEPVDRIPVWIMRQAGRYLPEYRKVRASVPDFMTLCKTPELACEVTMQPLARFDLDAAILFSDILTIPDAMGLGLEFVENVGPKFKYPVRDAASIHKLAVPDPEDTMGYVTKAIKAIKQALAQRIPLLGFSGSPWTLACYMVEGGGSKDFHRIKKLLYAEPALLQHLLNILTDAIVLYCQAQIAAGVDALMLFDTWGGVLSAPAYQQFSLNYMQQIIARLPADIPVILFTKGGGLWLESIAKSGCRGIGLDWTINVADACARIPKNIALQGNLDPNVLFASAETVTSSATQILQQAQHRPGYIFNLGHGILPATPIENVSALIETVHSFSTVL